MLTVLFNETLVNNEVTSKLMTFYPRLNSSGGMLFIELHSLVVFKNMLAEPIETSSPDWTNMVKKLSSQCSAFNDHIMLFTLPDAATNTSIVSKELHLHDVVVNSVEILDKSNK